MSVPSDDERDETFAKKFDIPIIPVVDKTEYPGASLHDKVGKLINSDFLNGMEVKAAISKTCERIEELGIGHAKVNYKLRDSNFSRQRYWGEPFPITYDSDNIASIVGLEDLPVELPHTQNFKPGKAGQSPLMRIPEWVNPSPGLTRETDTMPAVAGSSWYYLRYMDPQNEDALASRESIAYWKDIDLYVGGSEHAVAHLMYARFWHKFLFDLNIVSTTEPFKKLINQGMIQGVIEQLYLQKEKVDGINRFASLEVAQNETDVEWAKIPVHIDMVSDYGLETSYLSKQGILKFLEWIPEFKGNSTFETDKGKWKEDDLPEDIRFVTVSEVGKMSKSKYNVINPDDIIEQYGADCFRMYEMFLGPVEQSKPWDMKGIDGVSKFLKKYISLFHDGHGQFNLTNEEPEAEELKVLHMAIKKVSDDIERFSFNTCVSAFMVCTNELKKLGCRKQAILEPLNRLLASFAPYICEEINNKINPTSSVHLSDFPVHDENYLIEDSFEYPICFNGKKRGLQSFPSDMDNKAMEANIKELEVYKKWTDGLAVRKIIIVPKRMVNVVVG